MEKRKLGEDLVPLLGFGTMRLPTTNDKINLEAFKEMVDYSMEQGCNYFDTAYIYHSGLSEDAVKKAVVERYKRESFYVADKLPVWLVKEKDDYEKLFNDQLQRLGVDYFDFYLLHALDKDKYENNVNNYNGFEFCLQKKAEGKIKHLGFSFHDNYEMFEKIIEKHHHQIEFVQLQINYLDYELIKSNKCYELCKKHGLKVIVMEPVKGGSLANFNENILKMFKEKGTGTPASWALKYCGTLENVLTVLSGMSNMEQLKDNINTFKNFEPLKEEDYKFLNEIVLEMSKYANIPCTACDYCIDCPKDIKISHIFKVYNEVANSSNAFNGKMIYRTAISPKANECIECKKCESHCPQHIKIIDELKVAHKELTS